MVGVVEKCGVLLQPSLQLRKTTTCNTTHARLPKMGVYGRTEYKIITLNRTEPHILSIPRANLERTSSAMKANQERTTNCTASI